MYVSGLVTAMAGGSAAHSSLATNLLGLFHSALRGSRCRVYNNDLLFRTGSGEMYTYPDVMVICGGLETFAGRPHVVTNPVFVAEC
jgi:Uma2 family endonuclease